MDYIMNYDLKQIFYFLKSGCFIKESEKKKPTKIILTSKIYISEEIIIEALPKMVATRQPDAIGQCKFYLKFLKSNLIWIIVYI